MAKQVNFTPKNKTEGKLLTRIARRAAKLAAANGIEYDVQTADMDLTAAHLNGCPLDLRKLLSAEDKDFGHDVFGIRRFISRNTGKINPGKFWPRCGAKTK